MSNLTVPGQERKPWKSKKILSKMNFSEEVLCGAKEISNSNTGMTYLIQLSNQNVRNSILKTKKA